MQSKTPKNAVSKQGLYPIVCDQYEQVFLIDVRVQEKQLRFGAATVFPGISDAIITFYDYDVSGGGEADCGTVGVIEIAGIRTPEDWKNLNIPLFVSGLDSDSGHSYRYLDLAASDELDALDAADE